jgi:phage I-like protein
MTQRFGYIIDLREVKFDDASMTSWIHGAPLGEYTHPVYGEVDLTMERAERLAASVNNRVQDKDPDIDYDHKAYSGEAAGWVKGAETRADGLWLLVEWTQEAFDKIKKRAYRYFSPELVDEWEHPLKKVKYKDVLLGGGLTNRPFLKGIVPINMSELVIDEHKKEAVGMDPKELRKKLGLSEDATEEQVNTKLEELTKPPETTTEQTNTEAAATGVVAPSNEVIAPPTDAELNELLKSGDLVALSEKLPWVKSLVETNTQLQASLRMSEIDAQVERVMAPKDGKCIPETKRATVKALLMQAPNQQYSESVLGDVFSDMRTVQLGEIGSTGASGQRQAGDDPAKRFNDKVLEIMREDKIDDYGQAAERVAMLDPKLFMDYQNNNYAFRI